MRFREESELIGERPERKADGGGTEGGVRRKRPGQIKRRGKEGGALDRSRDKKIWEKNGRQSVKKRTGSRNAVEKRLARKRGKKCPSLA